MDNEELERRSNVPDIQMVADQALEDLRTGDDSEGFLDAIGTIGAHEMTEDEVIALTIELARRVIAIEPEQDED